MHRQALSLQEEKFWLKRSRFPCITAMLIAMVNKVIETFPIAEMQVEMFRK